MGHERVLNEDKVAHPDEGMVGIMREIERSRPSRAQGVSFGSPGTISEWLLGCGLSGLGFEVGDKSAKGTFRCDGAERLSEQVTSLPSTRCPPGKVIKGLDWPGWSSRRGRRHIRIHTFAIPAKVAGGRSVEGEER